MLRLPTLAASAATATFVVLTPAAQAASLNAADVLRLSNAATAGDLVSSREIEGRTYVGGNLSGNTIQVGFKRVAPSLFDKLIVVGSSSIGTINA